MSDKPENIIRIGLLEDDEQFTQSLAELFDYGSDVSLLRVWLNPDEAFKDIFENDYLNKIDAMIIDLMLPLPRDKTKICLDRRANSVSTGYYFHKFLAEKLNGDMFPCVFLTGALTDNQRFRDTVENYLDTHRDAVLLEKPVRLAEIISALKEVVSKARQ